MFEEPKDRLRAARIKAGYTSPKEAADFFGWSVDTLKSHEQAKRNISTNMAVRYGQAFKVSPAWILTGENPPDWHEVPEKKNTISIVRTRQVPIISYNALLNVYLKNLRLSSVMTNSETINVPVERDLSSELAAIKIDFDTNTGAITKGDIVVVDLEADWEYGNYVVVLMGNTDIAIMQVYEDTNTDNKRVPFLKHLTDGRMPVELRNSDAKIIGRIVFRGHYL